MRTIGSREFNQDTAGAKRAAADGPVVVTDRGEPSHVLMTWKDFTGLTNGSPSIGDLLGDPDAGKVDLPLPDREVDVRPPVDLND